MKMSDRICSGEAATSLRGANSVLLGFDEPKTLEHLRAKAVGLRAAYLLEHLPMLKYHGDDRRQHGGRRAERRENVERVAECAEIPQRKALCDQGKEHHRRHNGHHDEKSDKGESSKHGPRPNDAKKIG